MSDAEKIKKIVAQLINNHKVKNESDFCARLALGTGNLAKIKSGERKIPASLKLKLIKTFDVDPDQFSGQMTQIGENHPQEAAEPSPQYGPSEQVWKSAFESMAAAMKMLTDTNEDVLESNKLFRKMISAWMDKGALIMDNKKAGMKQD